MRRLNDDIDLLADAFGTCIFALHVAVARILPGHLTLGFPRVGLPSLLLAFGLDLGGFLHGAFGHLLAANGRTLSNRLDRRRWRGADVRDRPTKR